MIPSQALTKQKVTSLNHVLLAHGGHPTCTDECLLSGVKRT
jgi:hypothetical protein